MFPLPENTRCRTMAVARVTIRDQKTRICDGMPYISLSFRLGGEALLTVEDTTVRSKKHHVTLLPQHMAYTAQYYDNEMIFVHFSTDTPLYTALYDRPLRYPEEVQGLLCRLVAVWERREIGYRVEADALLMQVLVACARDGQAEGGVYATACALFRERLSDPSLSVEAVADAVRVSPSQLRRVFRARGESPHRYLDDLRLARAAELLLYGDLSVAETARHCGFADTRYFARVFKQRYGCTPSRFRLYR